MNDTSALDAMIIAKNPQLHTARAFLNGNWLDGLVRVGGSPFTKKKLPGSF